MTMDDEKVERVAKAIVAAYSDDRDHRTESYDLRAARAAIAAMDEPVIPSLRDEMRNMAADYTENWNNGCELADALADLVHRRLSEGADKRLRTSEFPRWHYEVEAVLAPLKGGGQ